MAALPLPDMAPLWAWLLYYDAGWDGDGEMAPAALLDRLVHRAETLLDTADQIQIPPLSEDDRAQIREEIQAVAQYWEAALAAGKFGTGGPADPEKILAVESALIAMDDPETTNAVYHLVTQLQQSQLRASEWPF